MRHLVLSLIVLLSACSLRETAPAPDATPRFVTDTTDAAYFGALRTLDDSFDVGGQAFVLHSMGEPSLRGASLPPGLLVMRFTWLRTFHDAISIRVMRGPKVCWIVTAVRNPDGVIVPELPPIPGQADGIIMLDNARSRRVPPTLLRRDSITAADSLCADLEADLHAFGLGHIPRRPQGLGFDGSSWIFERSDSTGHAWMRFWAPDSTFQPRIWSAGLAFAAAGRALPPPNERY